MHLLQCVSFNEKIHRTFLFRLMRLADSPGTNKPVRVDDIEIPPRLTTSRSFTSAGMYRCIWSLPHWHEHTCTPIQTCGALKHLFFRDPGFFRDVSCSQIQDREGSRPSADYPKSLLPCQSGMFQNYAHKHTAENIEIWWNLEENEVDPVRDLPELAARLTLRSPEIQRSLLLLNC